jgi:DNA-binding transcriptional regulator YiaG
VSNRDIEQPVEVALFFKAHGMTLSQAHETLDRIAARQTVPVELWAHDAAQLLRDLTALGVEALPIALPDINPKMVRERLGLSQAEFAIRFDLGLNTVQNWEEGRSSPDAAARLLLGIIDRDPALIDSLVTNRAVTEADG